MDPFRTALVDCFRRGEVPRDVRLMAARGALEVRVQEQLSLLMLLVDDPDPDVAAAADATVGRLPKEPMRALLSGQDVPAELREFFTTYRPGTRVGTASAPPAEDVAQEVGAPEGGASGPAPSAAEPGADGADEDPGRQAVAQRLALMNVAERMKVAMQGSREERSVLVRDPNRLVSSAVLSSPKLTESEVEAIARMTNVSEEVLRTVGTSRVWTKNYAVVAALTRNAKTPIAVSLTLLNRLAERDVKMLSTDRNVPEPVRLGARKIVTRKVSQR